MPQFTGILGGGVQNYFSRPQVTNGTLTPNTDYITEVLTDSAIAWINGQAQPWLCWLAYNAPHSPFHLPRPTCTPQGNLPTDSASIAADPLPYYLAMVESLDSELGRLLAAIPPAVLANTTIVFIGDNGTPGEAIQSPYQPNRARAPSTRAACTCHWSSPVGVTRQGEREPAPVVSTDLFATLVELTGEALPVYASSRSLVPLLTQGGLSHRDCLRVDAQPAGRGSATRRHATNRSRSATATNGSTPFPGRPDEATNLLFGGLTAQEQDAYDVLSEGCASITGIALGDADEQVSIYPNPTTGTSLLEGLTERQTIPRHGPARTGGAERERWIRTGRVDLGHLAPGTHPDVLHGNGFQPAGGGAALRCKEETGKGRCSTHPAWAQPALLFSPAMRQALSAPAAAGGPAPGGSAAGSATARRSTAWPWASPGRPDCVDAWFKHYRDKDPGPGRTNSAAATCAMPSC